MPSCCLRVTVVCPACEPFTSSCGLRVKYWRHTMSTRWLHEDITKSCCLPYTISQLRVSFVFPSCMVRESSCSLPQPSRSLRFENYFVTISGSNFAQNYKNHIRVSIASQIRDSVTPEIAIPAAQVYSRSHAEIIRFCTWDCRPCIYAVFRDFPLFLFEQSVFRRDVTSEQSK